MVTMDQLFHIFATTPEALSTTRLQVTMYLLPYLKSLRQKEGRAQSLQSQVDIRKRNKNLIIL